MGIVALDQIRTCATVAMGSLTKLLVHFLFNSGYRARLVASIVLV